MRELLARRKRATFHVYDLLAAEQMTMADLAPAERRELERVATQPIDEEISEFLDPADFEYFEPFERTLQLRSMFNSLAVQLRNTVCFFCEPRCCKGIVQHTVFRMIQFVDLL